MDRRTFVKLIPLTPAVTKLLSVPETKVDLADVVTPDADRVGIAGFHSTPPHRSRLDWMGNFTLTEPHGQQPKIILKS